MPSKPVDKETSEQMKRNKKIADLVESEGWAIARSLFIQKLQELNSVLSWSNGMSAQQIASEVVGREYACNVLYKFLAEIEGTAQEAKQTDAKIVRESFIVRTEA